MNNEQRVLNLDDGLAGQSSADFAFLHIIFTYTLHTYIHYTVRRVRIMWLGFPKLFRIHDILSECMKVMTFAKCTNNPAKVSIFRNRMGCLYIGWDFYIFILIQIIFSLFMDGWCWQIILIPNIFFILVPNFNALTAAVNSFAWRMPQRLTLF